MYIYIYIYINNTLYRNDTRDDTKYASLHDTTVGFHHFNLRIFNSRVSNPKNKNVVYLSVLSRISNYQGLGRKNKHENLKTDRTKYASLHDTTCSTI